LPDDWLAESGWLDIAGRRKFQPSGPANSSTSDATLIDLTIVETLGRDHDRFIFHAVWAPKHRNGNFGIGEPTLFRLSFALRRLISWARASLGVKMAVK